MKRSFFYSSFVLISLFVCTGCFDLNEYIYLKKDGSGKFSFVVDMSKMMSMSKMFDEGKTSTKSESESDKVNSTFERSKNKILAIPGISNYTEISDTVNYKFGFSFEFKTITDLNKAMNIVFAEDSAQTTTDYIFFDLRNNVLSRMEPNDVKSLIKGTSASGSTTAAPAAEKQLLNFDMVFSDIAYNTEYEFEQAIDSVANAESMFSANKKKVILTCHPFAMDSISATCSLKNKIFLK